MPKPATAPKPAVPQARFRLRITAGETIAIGPGKIALLEAVARTGSITTAAKSLDMSYRRAWLLLDELNGQLKQPAVDSSKGGQHGGGTALTAIGEQLVETYRRIESTAEKATAADMRALVRLLNR
jgi:molybdate transport system regulatory protein